MTDVELLPPPSTLAPPVFLLRSINERLWNNAAEILREDSHVERTWIVVSVHFSNILNINRQQELVGAWIFVLQRNGANGFDRLTSNVDAETARSLHTSIDCEYSWNDEMYTAAMDNIKERSVHRECTY
jgi:hypothetical protein